MTVVRFKAFAKESSSRSIDGSEELLTVSHITGVTPRSEKTVYMFEAESLEGYKLVEPGDLVVNTMWAWMGALGVARTRGIVSPSYAVYRLDTRKVDPRFVEGYLRQPQVVAEMTARSTGVWTSRLRLYPEALLDMRIDLPSRERQAAVADYLDTETKRLDRIVNRRLRVRQLVIDREESIVRALIMTADGPKRPVAALARYVNGFPFKPTDFTPSGLPVIRIAQLTDPHAEMDLFDGWVPPEVRLTNGDLIFSWSASLEVRLWDRGPAILNQHLFRVLPAQGVDRDWLRWGLHVVRPDFRELMHGSTMTHVTRQMMREVRIPVPSPVSQREIAAKADHSHAATSRLLRHLDSQLELMAERRQALITAAITSQIEIPGVPA